MTRYIKMAIAAVSMLLALPSPAGAAKPVVGTMAPDFELTLMGGSKDVNDGSKVHTARSPACRPTSSSIRQSDEWSVQRARYMTLETMAPVSDNPIVMLLAVRGA